MLQMFPGNALREGLDQIDVNLSSKVDSAVLTHQEDRASRVHDRCEPLRQRQFVFWESKQRLQRLGLAGCIYGLTVLSWQSFMMKTYPSGIGTASLSGLLRAKWACCRSAALLVSRVFAAAFYFTDAGDVLSVRLVPAR